MRLLEWIISEEVKFLFVVGRSGLFNHVALNVFLKNRLPLLNMLANHARSRVGVGTRGMTYPQVEFETFCDGRFEGRNSLQEINCFSPRLGVGVMNQ